MNKWPMLFLNGEKYQLAAAIIICCFLLWVYGCESTVKSISDPSKKITRAELQIEIEHILSQAEIRFLDLDKQDEIRKAISEQALIVGRGGVINPAGIFITALSILGVGASVDNLRKRKKIKEVLNQ